MKSSIRKLKLCFMSDILSDELAFGYTDKIGHSDQLDQLVVYNLHSENCKFVKVLTKMNNKMIK